MGYILLGCLAFLIAFDLGALKDVTYSPSASLPMSNRTQMYHKAFDNE